MSSFRRPIARLPDTGTGDGVSVPAFAPTGEARAAEGKWASAFGRDEPHSVRFRRMHPGGSTGIIRLPKIEDWVSRRAETAENFAFFNDPAAMKGLDEGMWPAELARNLQREDDLAQSLMGGNRIGGSYLKLGCKGGNDIAAACRVFSNVFALDVSIDMLVASAKVVANARGQEGVDKLTLIRGDMADDIRPIHPQTIDFAMCGFNHFGNLGRERQYALLKQAHRFMKHSVSGLNKRDIFPLLLTIYLDNPKTARMQNEFCVNMGLEPITTWEESEQGIAAARSPSGSVLRSERFSMEKITRIIAKANKCIPEHPLRIFETINLSETMTAIILHVQRTVSDEVADGTIMEDLDAPIDVK